MDISDYRRHKYENEDLNIWDCVKINEGYTINNMVQFFGIAIMIFTFCFFLGLLVYFIGFKPIFSSRSSRVSPQLGGSELSNVKALVWGGFFGFCGVVVFLLYSIYHYFECKKETVYYGSTK